MFYQSNNVSVRHKVKEIKYKNLPYFIDFLGLIPLSASSRDLLKKYYQAGREFTFFRIAICD
jgi:hypothetical protein